MIGLDSIVVNGDMMDTVNISDYSLARFHCVCGDSNVAFKLPLFLLLFELYQNVH